MKFVGVVLLGCVGMVACSSGGSSPDGTGGSAGTGAFPGGGAGGMQSPGGSGNVAGTGNVGNSGGAGNTGNSGGVGNTGNVGGTGNTGNVGGTGNTGNVGGTGNTGNSGGVGNTGNVGGTGNAGGMAGGGAGGGGPIPGEPPVVNGCGSAKIYQADADPGKPGPWPVGVKTVHVAVGSYQMPVEIWYPAVFGSDGGKTPAQYDLTVWLDPAQAMKIPAAANTPAVCDFTKLGEGKCYKDLPLDTTHGPYPAVIFIHGTGSFRVASMSSMVAWASHGFIAVAADHPGLGLGDFLGAGCGKGSGLTQDLSRDVDAEIAALTGKTGELAFLGSSVDMSRIGMSGHSQGASNAATFGAKPNVQVDMPFADLGGTAVVGSMIKGVLLAGGASDSVVPYSSDQAAYTSAPGGHKYLVGFTAGGHLDVTDLCWSKNSMGMTSIQVANMYITGCASLILLNTLAQCGTMPDPTKGAAIVNYASTALLEQTLNCQDRSAAWSNLKTQFPQVSDFQHMP